jgi:hypothetical protein
VCLDSAVSVLRDCVRQSPIDLIDLRFQAAHCSTVKGIHYYTKLATCLYCSMTRVCEVMEQEGPSKWAEMEVRLRTSDHKSRAQKGRRYSTPSEQRHMEDPDWPVSPQALVPESAP